MGGGVGLGGWGAGCAEHNCEPGLEDQRLVVVFQVSSAKHGDFFSLLNY